MPHAAAMPSPQPLLIDAAGHTCMAWWHAPRSSADARAAPALPRGWLASGSLPLAVVLASSWGQEDLCGYDGLRALAIALAESGIGSLRFEWPDTGDSSAASGSTSLADALAAFDAAARQALALSGGGRLAFVGLRLGALLAAHAAVARDDVDALVALLPVASGLAFVREQPAPDAARAAAVAAPRPGALFDAAALPVPLGGFAQALRQVEALSALRWPSHASASLRDALLLCSPGAPDRAASDALVRLGVRVREWAHDDVSGAPAATCPPVLAPAALAEIVRWLGERAGDGAATAATASASTATADAQLEAATGAVLALSAAGERCWMPLLADRVAIRERLVRIGEPRDRDPPLLAGVLGDHDAPAAARAPRRGLLLLSPGPVRRVGPHRLWVPWARRRAAHGDVVLRLDLPGIGDSARHARPDPGRVDPFDDRGVEAVARAVAWLRREQGVGDCTVMGVGAGAWLAWRAALAGADVQQVVAINPPIRNGVNGLSIAPADDVPGRIGAVPGHASRQPAPGGTRDRFGAVARALAARARHALRLCARGLRRPLADDLAADLARVSTRGVALDFVFSPGDAGLARLRQEAGRRATRPASDGRLTVGVVPHADSTFAATAGRDALYACLDSLLRPARAAATSPAAAETPAAGRPVPSAEAA